MDESESMTFAVHLICNGAFRSTSDMSYHSRTSQVLPIHSSPGNSGGPVPPLKVRQRWAHLPKSALETVLPLLEGRYAIPQKTQTSIRYGSTRAPDDGLLRKAAGNCGYENLQIPSKLIALSSKFWPLR